MTRQQETSKFNPGAYWEERLKGNFSLTGVGDIRFPVSYNRYLYSLRGLAFQKALQQIKRDYQEFDVLDVGSGVGFYIDQWKRTGVRHVSGSDITSTSVAQLGDRFPDSTFSQWDAGSEDIPFDQEFGAISAFDVLFHVTDEERFARAISNISSLLTRGGYFLYSDYFMRGDEKRMEHVVFRNGKSTIDLIQNAGMEIVLRTPVFYMMNSPLVTEQRLPRYLFHLLLKSAGRSELLGRLVGGIAYPLEYLLLKLPVSATGTEIIVFQKTS